MPDTDKDEPKQPHTPTPPQAQAAAATATPSTAPSTAPAVDDEVNEDVQTAHERMIKAEIEAGKTQVNATERLEKARANVVKAEAKAVGAAVDGDKEFAGYYLKLWGGHKALQCAYCPWDVITSSLFNYQERMQEHLNQAHPNRAQLTPLYDETGNAIVPAEVEEEE